MQAPSFWLQRISKEIHMREQICQIKYLMVRLPFQTPQVSIIAQFSIQSLFQTPWANRLRTRCSQTSQ
ncbi:hypothetical protein FGO68_gene3075 [Halteria grandinella]|uniref:Uncharacterized protein n=1 Tax=Halteria grandinella TaxID=5974 RepID=A0A8J8P5U5_HALGN|nr:hypothetical protein FGO68_gene3075 [Halteria grandinella]